MSGSAINPKKVRSSMTSDRQVVARPAFTIIGLCIRTTNAQEMSQHGGQIGPLWGRFMQQQARGNLTSLDPEITYSAYTRYDSDEAGAYDVVLGKAVSPAQEAALGMERLSIQSGLYMVFPSTSNSPESIKAAWMSVYSFFTTHPEKRRAFTTDYEEHSKTGTQLFIAMM